MGTYNYPRDKKGIDTLYVGDSVFIIHFGIDSVYKAAYQPQEQAEGY